MSAAVVQSYPPVLRFVDLERLEVCGPGDRDEFWADIHQGIQQQLTRLEAEVRRKVDRIRVDEGRTSGGNFFLFSYRTFSIPDSDLDPVVVGITFTPASEGVTVEADISGEQMGDLVASLPTITVADSPKELLETASALARKLCQSASAIATALKDRARRVG